MKYRVVGFCFLVILLALTVLSAPSWAASISGTVTNSSGKSGRIYVAVLNTGLGAMGYGVSLASSGGSFSIQGVPDNLQCYVVAFVDTTNTGFRHSNDPLALSGSFITGTGDTNIGTLSTSNPTSVPPVAPDTVGVIPGNGGTLIVWDGPMDNYGAPIAEKYNIYWSSNGSTVAGSQLNLSPGDQDFWVHNGGAYPYYKVEAVVGTIKAASTWFPATPASGVTVSGTVTVTGATPAGPLYVALVDFSGDTPKFNVAAVNSPSSSQSYSISGVAKGTYSIYPVIDMNNNGTIDYGDITLPDYRMAPQVTVGASDVSGANVTLTAQSAVAVVGTTHYKSDSYEGYGLRFIVEGMQKKVVNARITSGYNITTPIDVGVNEWGAYNLWLGINSVPAVGQQYTFNVTYEDGSSDTLNPQITGVLTGFPTPTAPLGTIPYGTGDTAGKPTFSWSAPNPAPSTDYRYDLWVNGDNTHWETDEDLPSSQLSIVYNADGTAEPSALAANQTYFWGISVTDVDGNRAENYATFKPITNPPQITDFTPAYAPAGSSLTINGYNFMAKNTDNTVKIGGVAATVTDASENQLMVTVPEGAISGTISVTTANGTVTSSTSFTRQYNLTVTLAGTGGGTVTSDPAGINCTSGSSSGCVASYDKDVNVTLTPTANSSSIFGGWSGCTSVVGNDCKVTMSANKTTTATFTTSPLVKIGETPYDKLQSAYNAATNGATIKAKEHTFIEQLLLNRDNIYVTLEGGYNSLYTDNPFYTTIQGTLTIGKGGATIEQFVIR